MAHQHSMDPRQQLRTLAATDTSSDGASHMHLAEQMDVEFNLHTSAHKRNYESSLTKSRSQAFFKERTWSSAMACRLAQQAISSRFRASVSSLSLRRCPSSVMYDLYGFKYHFADSVTRSDHWEQVHVFVSLYIYSIKDTKRALILEKIKLRHRNTC